ncbi:peptide transporter ptr2 [Podila epigama]|nr:peptide transporter ptr2 [Podila epigama]
MSKEELDHEKAEDSVPRPLDRVELDEDLANNIQVAGPIPVSAWLIIVTELAERFAFYGASMLFQRYMLTRLKLEKGNATAISRGFQFFSYATTIFGAVVADKWLGKFKTVLIFSIVYTLGLILLSVSAMDNFQDSFALPGFIIALYCLISWGTGGIKSNVSAFAAEQIPPEDYAHPTKAGHTINHAITVERIFRYFYMAINVGGMLGQGITPTVSKQVGWDIAYMIPAIVFVIGIIIFSLGRTRYTDRPPNGSILGKTYRCTSYAFRNRTKRAAGTHWIQAAKVPGEGSEEWDVAFMLSFINSAVIVIFIPIFDTIVFPILRRAGFKLGPIARITIGFVIVSLCFIYVTVLQHFLYQSAPYYNFTGKNPNDPSAIIEVPEDIELRINELSIWTQLPAYIFIGISEIFASATGLEFAFRMASVELKSVVMSMFLATNAFGSLIGMVLSIWSNDPNFVYLYAGQAAVMFTMTGLFSWKFHKLDDLI